MEFLEGLGHWFGKHIRTVNQFIKVNTKIEIPVHLNEEQYKDLYKSLVALPGFMAFNLFVWIFILF